MNQFLPKNLWVLVILFCACESLDKEKEPFVGTWEAKWHTTPEAFPDIKDSDLTMNGVFDFTQNDVSVTLYGYPGCLFSHDTISNRTEWAISGDSLSLINEDNTPSISYKIMSRDPTKVELVFLEDIFVTLTR